MLKVLCNRLVYIKEGKKYLLFVTFFAIGIPNPESIIPNVKRDRSFREFDHVLIGNKQTRYFCMHNSWWNASRLFNNIIVIFFFFFPFGWYDLCFIRIRDRDNREEEKHLLSHLLRNLCIQHVYMAYYNMYTRGDTLAWKSN